MATYKIRTETDVDLSRNCVVGQSTCTYRELEFFALQCNIRPIKIFALYLNILKNV
jgi:hypothetical protein